MPTPALTVVMAAKGYPGTPEKGGAIGLNDAESGGAKVFHASTALKDGALVANGGRVLKCHRDRAAPSPKRSASPMKRSTQSTFETGFCRRDIGWREVAREA